MKYIIISGVWHAGWIAAACFWAPAVLAPVIGALAGAVMVDGGAQ